MYIFKNAGLNIIRNKGRNILIGIIVLVIAISSTIALAIQNTASSLIKSYTESYEVEATISFDRESMKDNFDFTNSEGMEGMKDAFSNLNQLTKEEILEYVDSEYVKSYYYTQSISLNGNNIEKVSSEFSFERREEKNKPDREGNNSTNDFTLNGYNSINSMTEFINGNYTMVESTENIWNIIFEGNYCIISSELAELNEINLNDSIELIDNEENIIELTVIGIYEEKTSESDNFSMFSNSANIIITNPTVIDEIKEQNENIVDTVSATFILNSFDDVEKFQEELYEKGLSEYYTVNTNEETVETAVSGIKNLSSFSLMILIITFIVGAVVLLVINQINIRERKYEIGVLRTIGMKKITVLFQFITELLIVTILSLMIGCGIGAIISKPVGNMLLQSEIESSEQKQENIGNNFGNNGQKPDFQINNVVTVEKIDTIDAVVDLKVILELLGIGILLTLISSIVSMISIQRFSPLTILKERS